MLDLILVPTIAVLVTAGIVSAIRLEAGDTTLQHGSESLDDAR